MNILYFAWMREHTGCAAEEIDLPDGVSEVDLVWKTYISGAIPNQKNEFATLLLISIVSLAILKTALSWVKAVVVFLLIGIILFTLIKLYKKYINSKTD